MLSALRSLRSNRGLTVVAILSLALGIGASTAIFSLIDAVMLEPLPVDRPEELVQVAIGSGAAFGNPIWEQLRDRQDVFSGIFAYGRWFFDLARGGEVRTANGQYVSGQYFETLLVKASVGRVLVPADDRRTCAPVAVLAHAFWRKEYGGLTAAVGKTISLDNHPFDIVGVASRDFSGVEVGQPADVFVPLCAERIIHAEAPLLDRNYLPGWLQVIGRLKPWVTETQANARLKAIAPEIFRASLPPGWRAEDQAAYLRNTLDTEGANNGLSWTRRRYRQALAVLMSIVSLVLLIACANVANLLLARGAAREREIAIRQALGCGRFRLVRQLLLESLVLAGTGAAIGVLFAQWGARALAAFLDVRLDLALNLRVLAFTAAVAIFTGVLFGIAPAWRGARVPVHAAMKAGGRGVIGSRFGLGKALVIAQVGVAVLLVAGAGLMLSTLRKLMALDAGFERGNLLLITVDIRNGNYAPERRRVVFREMLDRLRAVPGVRSAGVSNIAPLCGCKATLDLAVDGYHPSSREDSAVLFNKVSDGYFETLGTPVLLGRDFNGHDSPGSPRVAVVNQSLARKYFGTASPLGRYLRLQEGEQAGKAWEIVGVVKDAKYGSLRDEMAPVLYLSRNQDESSGWLVYLEARAPEAVIRGTKTAIAEVDSRASLYFSSLQSEVEKSLLRERLLSYLSGLFGALALLLAAIGLYGVMSYTVARRRNEIGIRIALGSAQSGVLRMVMREVAILIGAGIVLGFCASSIATRFVSSFLYDLRPNDPLTLGTSAALLAAVGVFSGYWPARRAARLDPMTALREE